MDPIDSMLQAARQQSEQIDARMSMSEIERAVVQVQTKLATGLRSDQIAAFDLLHRDFRVQQLFLQSFDDGYLLPAASLDAICVNPWVEKAMPGAWLRAEMFEDDEHFMPGRFYITVSNSGQLAHLGLEEKAVAQAKRLLAKGEMDAEYLRSLRWAESSVVPFDVESLVYLDEGAEQLMMMVSMLRGMPNFETNQAAQRALADTQKRIVWIDAERERVFKELWLPAMLSPEEWATVKNVQGSLLRELYASEWQQGYAGYRAIMSAR